MTIFLFILLILIISLTRVLFISKFAPELQVDDDSFLKKITDFTKMYPVKGGFILMLTLMQICIAVLLMMTILYRYI